MKALLNYRKLIDRVDKACHRIQERYTGHIACEKGCIGNCCRIHLSVFPIEAVSLAIALKKLPRDTVRRIRQKAGHSSSFGPCPLLEDGGCLMYPSRLLICRTHGLPMRNQYRGNQFIGVCRKNFREINSIPDDAVMDLDRLNKNLAAVNQLFIDECSDRFGLIRRVTIGEALLLDLP